MVVVLEEGEELEGNLLRDGGVGLVLGGRVEDPEDPLSAGLVGGEGKGSQDILGAFFCGRELEERRALAQGPVQETLGVLSAGGVEGLEMGEGESQGLGCPLPLALGHEKPHKLQE